MFRKIRYLIVVCTGIVLVALTIGISAFIKKDNEITTERNQGETLENGFGVQDVTENAHGNYPGTEESKATDDLEPTENEKSSDSSTVDNTIPHIIETQEDTARTKAETLEKLREESKETESEEKTEDTEKTEKTENEASSDITETDDETQEITEKSEEESETEGTSETEKETEATKEPETETTKETEPETEPEIICGLRAHFEGKLVLNLEKSSANLKMYMYPDADSEVVDYLRPNEIVEYISKTGNWYEVKRSDFEGYVSASYVLTDGDAYRQRMHSVSYAVIVKFNNTWLYVKPDEESDGVIRPKKGDKYRIIGIEGDYYKVYIGTDEYRYLYLKKTCGVLYYLFLSPNDDNGLSEEDEAYFHSLEIDNSLAEKILIEREAEEERLRIEESIENSIRQSIYESSIERSVKVSSYEAAAYSKAVERECLEKAISDAKANGNSEAVEALENGTAVSLGIMRITHYCNCTKCSGIYGSNDPGFVGHGSSGEVLTANHSVAVYLPQIPYGTKLLIHGKVYYADDTGVPLNCIDIFCASHSAVDKGGMYYAEVYILP